MQRRDAGRIGTAVLAAMVLSVTASAWDWGTTNWSVKTLGAVSSTPLISPRDGRIYVASKMWVNVWPFNFTIPLLYILNSDGTTNKVLTAPIPYADDGMHACPSPAMDMQGNVYVAQGYGMTQFTPEGGTGNVYTLPGFTRSSPAIGRDGTIYVVSPTNFALWGIHLGVDQLFAFTPQGNTSHVWECNLHGQVISNFYTASPVIGQDGTIYVASQDGGLHGFNPDGTTGHVWWTSGVLVSTPAIGEDGTIYVGSCDSNVYAFNPDGTTQRVWKTMGRVTSSPVIGPTGTIYVATTWEFSIMGLDMAYDSLYGLNPNGSTAGVWGAASVYASDPHNTCPPPVVANNGSIVMASMDGYIYAFNPDGTTNRIWSTSYMKNQAAPAIGPNGVLYYGCMDSNLYAFAGLQSVPGDTVWPSFRRDIFQTGRAWMPAPGGVAASDGTSTNHVTVSWNTVPEAMGYSILRHTANEPAAAVPVGWVSGGNSFDDDSALPGVRYHYWVRATDWAADGARSVPNTGYRAMPSPLNLAATDRIHRDKVRVSWDAISGATSYQVLRSSSVSPGSASVVSNTTLGWADDVPPVKGIRYYYWVKAAGHVSTSSLSGPVYGSRLGLPPSYGGGPSELVVFDTNNGYWYIREAADPTVVLWAEPWGWRNAWPVSGDYNGDGYSDMAVFDQNSGNWYARSITGGAPIIWAISFGWPGAVPVAGDYDGDAISDLAVFDSRNGNWYIRSPCCSTPILWQQAWGWPGAIPIPGDYDGDGRSDLAVFDQNTGNWYIRSVAGGAPITWAVSFGWPGARPVSGDYDGDGCHDLAVFDTVRGFWYAATRTGAVIFWAVPWGWPGATPVPGDYDADGVSDLAVFDTNTGFWYVYSTQTASAVVWAQGWGWPGAYPVAGAAWGR